MNRQNMRENDREPLGLEPVSQAVTLSLLS